MGGSSLLPIKSSSFDGLDACTVGEPGGWFWSLSEDPNGPQSNTPLGAELVLRAPSLDYMLPGG